MRTTEEEIEKFKMVWESCKKIGWTSSTVPLELRAISDIEELKAKCDVLMEFREKVSKIKNIYCRKIAKETLKKFDEIGEQYNETK